MSEASFVLGRSVQLDETRLVFVGQRDGDNSFYLGFRSAEGEITHVKLSPEAWDALYWLHDNPAEDPQERLPCKLAESCQHAKWTYRVVSDANTHLITPEP